MPHDLRGQPCYPRPLGCVLTGDFTGALYMTEGSMSRIGVIGLTGVGVGGHYGWDDHVQSM